MNKFNGEKNVLSRRDALVILGVGSAAFLVSCVSSTADKTSTPDGQINPVKAEDPKYLEELRLFGEVSERLESTYGHNYLGLTFSDCVRDFYNGWKDKKLGIYNPDLDAANWGTEIDKLPEVVDNHFNNVLKVIIEPAPPENPSYVPPTKEEIDTFLGGFKNTFGLQTLAVDTIHFSPLPYIGFANPSDQPNPILDDKYTMKPYSVFVPSPNINLENSFVATEHEINHNADALWRRFKKYIDFKTYAMNPTAIQVSTEVIANQCFSESTTFQNFKNYGLSIRVNLAPHIFDLALNNLDFKGKFPDDMIEKYGDSEDLIKKKKDMQFNYMIYNVGQSLKNGGSDYKKSGGEIKDEAQQLMAVYFDEVHHYLVGPYQFKSGFPTDYALLDTTGINGPNLERHKVTMEVFANPGLSRDPHDIRVALGLSKEIKAGDIMIFNGVQMFGNLERSDGKTYEAFKLPENAYDDIFYLKDIDSPYGYLTLFDNKTKTPPNLFFVENAVFNRSLFPKENLAITDQEPKLIDSGNFGKFTSDKLTYKLVTFMYPNKDFIYLKDEFGKTKIYENRLLLDDIKNVLFIHTQGLRQDAVTDDSLILATNGAISVTERELLPHIKGVQMRILGTANSKITIGDIDEVDGDYGKYEFTMSSLDHDEIRGYLARNPGTKASVEFVVENGELQIKLHIFYNATYPENDKVFTVNTMNVVRFGRLGEPPIEM